jgi:magnesium transporter
VKALLYEGFGYRELNKPEIDAALGNADSVVWFDMTGPTADDTRFMREVLKFHPLTVEQVLDHKQRPKVEEYPDHLFAIMNSAHVDGQDVYFRELDIFVTRNVVVTVHRFPEPAVDQARKSVNEICTTKGMTVGFLLYSLIKVMVDSYFPVLDKLEQQLERVEDEVIERPTQDKLQRLFQLKRAVAEIWRISAQQRDMFSLLMREESPYINHTTLRLYLRDVYDHLLLIHDQANAVRDNVATAVDLFFSSQSQQLNQYVNRLTLITIATGILAVVTGFFGMNFEVMWPLSMDNPGGVYFVVAAVILVIVLFWAILERQRRQ